MLPEVRRCCHFVSIRHIYLVRLCLEGILTGEPLAYQGNVLAHLVELRSMNQEVGEKVALLYREKRK